MGLGFLHNVDFAWGRYTEKGVFNSIQFIPFNIFNYPLSIIEQKLHKSSPIFYSIHVFYFSHSYLSF